MNYKNPYLYIAFTFPGNLTLFYIEFCFNTLHPVACNDKVLFTILISLVNSHLF